MEVVEYAGWQCHRVVSGDVEALVTLSVGPRVIRLGHAGAANLFYEKPAHRGLAGGTEYRGYGGHRLWLAPEDPATTYWPDNEPVEVREGWCFNAPDARGLKRGMRLTPLGGGRFEIAHRVTNVGGQPSRVSLWSLSVMAPGGVCLVPQPELQTHGVTALLPNRSMALWPYTNLGDRRFEWGLDAWRIRQSPEGEPTKLGAWVEAGWAAYESRTATFLKTFPALAGEYPDHGCNFEVFTRHDMLEVESLGALTAVEPGASADHVERWQVFRGAPSVRELGLAAGELARA